MDAPEVLTGSRVKGDAALRGRACCPLPCPTLSRAKCVTPAQHGKSRRNVKALPKSKGNNNYSEKFWVEQSFFEGCGVLQSPGVISF